MSEFDKEAEREKLREKFAKDEEKRKSTKRMSELLLKGATMTNRHCNSCGDPIFRFDEQNFCPSCQDAEVAGGQIRLRNPEGRGGADGRPTGEATEATEATQTADSVGTGESATETPTQTTAPTRTADPTPGADDGDESETPVEPTQPPVSTVQTPTSETETATETPAEATTPSAPTTSDGSDLDAARASLRRTVTRYAEEAERTDDPRRARELLAAAREAAETLAALRR
ncbi:Sjogren's syndrome/scleroderma autoantigen 1 (Autoantigen p27) [Halogranum amylolyticum]|uniref:Sjogren's syndrome/scleroderma autoantigen 1 (Autoantigen p27) n=1 Tax=Halogranum amylolyticum TaxID=660520 RepID=A0A1H8R3H6_9EURY|nr:Sjogren's syndrome/scleroderma autoantigen 1 family protein [Halogranum amylolyticum]SEO60876.1 Sjogren's syndrome/scleroderma autoantigen 1 (Autoantigen p27) [Halogranum amylolyticum]